MSAPVYSFVAWSGTGKTTLLENLVAELTRRGQRVAVVKHDGHDFQADTPGKDSYRMTQAGAAVSAVTNGAHGAVFINRPVTVEDIVDSLRDVDIILVEGYKQGPYPKIGLMRAATGKGLPPVAGDYVLVLADSPVDVSCPVLGLEDVSALADFVMKNE
jgi:molybdopterin-guanine dinucleotide biosynthesis protein MobB